MSDYKVVATDIEIVDRECLIKALEAMFGSVEENVMAQQRWSNHNRTVDICIRQSQLPEELQGFGDVGLIQRGGKYVFLGVSDHDSSYMDRDKRAAMMRAGKSERQALQEQPDGTFSAKMNEYFKTLENGYEEFNFAKQIQKKCPSAQFGQVSGKANDSRAWMMRGSVTAADLARLGIAVPR